jgi:preprotein translocase subunit SecF
MFNKEKVEEFYSKNYKLLMIIPIILLVLSLSFLGVKYAVTGEIMPRDIGLKGGVVATVYTDKQFDINALKSSVDTEINTRILTDFATGKQVGFSVETSELKSDQLKPLLENFVGFKLNQDNFSIEETSSSLGESFFFQLLLANLFAFILMGIAVFVGFRTFIPSIAVIFSAFTDIVVTLGIISLLNIEISAAGIVAFLLVIGYSVDTDILLTTRMIKRRQPVLFERMLSSLKTGLTMTFATIIALTAGLIISNSSIIKEMFTIIIIALFIDILTTYLTNAGILILYCKKKDIR